MADHDEIRELIDDSERLKAESERLIKEAERLRKGARANIQEGSPEPTKGFDDAALEDRPEG